MKPALLRHPAGQELLQRLAGERGLDPAAVEEVMEALDEHAGMLRRRGLFKRFDAIMDKARD